MESGTREETWNQHGKKHLVALASVDVIPGICPQEADVICDKNPGPLRLINLPLSLIIFRHIKHNISFNDSQLAYGLESLVHKYWQNKWLFV